MNPLAWLGKLINWNAVVEASQLAQEFPDVTTLQNEVVHNLCKTTQSFDTASPEPYDRNKTILGDQDDDKSNLQ